MARAILTGDKELQLALKRLPEATFRGMDPTIRAALEPMQSQAKLNALRLRQPGGTPKGGHLDQGIVTRKIEGRGRTTREFWVALTRRARSIGHLVEFGTRPHDQPRRKIRHPGATPKPFMTPAFESTKATVLQRLGEGTWAVIAAAANVIGKKR